MKSIFLLFSLCILFSCASISQTYQVYFENVGNCDYSPSSSLSRLKAAKDSTQLDVICSFKTENHTDYYFEKSLFNSLDSILKNDTFFVSFIVDESKDSSLFPSFFSGYEFAKYPAGSFLITSYDKSCKIQYQYLILGSEKTIKTFEYLNQIIKSSNKEFIQFQESNLLDISICVELDGLNR